jgi:hypothetical protein
MWYFELLLSVRQAASDYRGLAYLDVDTIYNLYSTFAMCHSNLSITVAKHDESSTIEFIY